MYKLNRNMPNKEKLRSHLVSLCALEIISSNEDSERLHKFVKRSELGELFHLDAAAGDNLYLLFSKDGIIVRGFDHESELSPYNKESFEPVKGIYENAPAALLDSLRKMIIYEEDFDEVTFCAWNLVDSTNWFMGKPESNRKDSGIWLGDLEQERLLSPKDWCVEVGAQVFGLDIHEDIVEDIFNHQPIEPKTISQLNPDRNVNSALADLISLQYPVEK